jgi:hypothetical protein
MMFSEVREPGDERGRGPPGPRAVVAVYFSACNSGLEVDTNSVRIRERSAGAVSPASSFGHSATQTSAWG